MHTLDPENKALPYPMREITCFNKEKISLSKEAKIIEPLKWIVIDKVTLINNTRDRIVVTVDPWRTDQYHVRIEGSLRTVPQVKG